MITTQGRLRPASDRLLAQLLVFPVTTFEGSRTSIGRDTAMAEHPAPCSYTEVVACEGYRHTWKR